MPGLYALLSWEALPLKSSTVKACANGYSLSITAHLMYTNPHKEPVEGKGGAVRSSRDPGCPLKAPVLESILSVSQPPNLAQFGEQRWRPAEVGPLSCTVGRRRVRLSKQIPITEE